MTTIEEKTTTIDDMTLHSLEAGDPKNKTIILLHGMKFNAETWQGLGTIEKLTDFGFHTVALDMPGFGKSPKNDMPPSDVLKRFIDSNNIDTPLLIGPSMGGKIAIEFSLAHPDMVKGLILIGPVGVQENQGRLAEITVPTLLVWGGEDTISPLENAQLLKKELSDAKLVIFEGAPHPCYLEKTAEWHKELLQFLEG